MYKTIIVDDEDIAVHKFRHLLVNEKRLSLVETFDTAEAALDYVKNNTIDVAFLDIQMPGTSGLKLADMILEQDPCVSIIFLTAYDSYALDAFRAHAMGYLLKPLSPEDLEKQVNILEQRIQPREAKIAPQISTSNCRLQVTVFGDFQCRTDKEGSENLAFRTSKTAELFLLLHNKRGLALTKESILESLFPDTDDYEKANKLFYVSCSYLRSMFSQNELPPLLIRENESYRIASCYIDSDYFLFLDVVEHLSSASVEQLLAANHAYKGEYLPARPYEWACEARSYLETQHRKLVLELAERYCKSDKHDEAFHTLEAYLAFDSCDEDIITRMIKMKLDDNQSQAAYNIYKSYEKRLATLYDDSPSNDLKKLFKDRSR